MKYLRDDAIAPALRAPDRAYRVMDDRDRLLGVVAGSGRLWAAGRIGPKRSMPIIPASVAETRAAAVERMVRGRP